MRHSRSISDLRADVAENCRTLLTLAEREGLSVLVTETVRDAAYQRMLAEKGYAAKGAVTPSFHAEHAGLAFDICKNEVGHEYDDPAFFARMGGDRKASRIFLGRRLGELSRPAAFSVGRGRSVHERDDPREALSAAHAAL